MPDTCTAPPLTLLCSQALQEVLKPGKVPEDAVGFGTTLTAPMDKAYARYCHSHGINPLQPERRLVQVHNFSEHGSLLQPLHRHGGGTEAEQLQLQEHLYW